MTTTRIEDEWLSIEEAAIALGYSHPRTLSNRICRKLPVPAYVKVPGSRKILFFKTDVKAFLESHRTPAPSHEAAS